VEVRRESYAGLVGRALAAALEVELLDRYAGRAGSGAEPSASDLEPPNGAFLVGYEDGEPVCCGGVCRYDERIAEIRRMFVIPAARGRGFSRVLLAALEEEARRLGYSVVRLETGDRQPEAIRLYESAGYEPIARYRPYVADERSVCLEKRLA
jgi:GNAT superfamily N-acetyltransferase